MAKRALNKGIRLSLLLFILLVTSVTKARSEVQPTPPIFGDITIGNNFSPDPLTVRGMSGGSVAGQKVAKRSETATGPCTGYVDDAPDHKLELKNKFDYLKLLVESPEDTTLIVKGPGGTWCNDEFDGKGKNPGIVGEWLPGTYHVWVGSYVKGKYFPYTLQITERK
jgi:hypothetical protein